MWGGTSIGFTLVLAWFMSGWGGVQRKGDHTKALVESEPRPPDEIRTVPGARGGIAVSIPDHRRVFSTMVARSQHSA